MNIPWWEMADLRNIIVHEYFGVNEKIIWETIQTDLPGLLSSLREIHYTLSRNNSSTLKGLNRQPAKSTIQIPKIEHQTPIQKTKHF